MGKEPKGLASEQSIYIEFLHSRAAWECIAGAPRQVTSPTDRQSFRVLDGQTKRNTPARLYPIFQAALDLERLVVA
jgi:hypothetical protein